ncbi:MAG TPA: bifunctional phosphopantothenoylcysteine decarboxylase/phosphopantothenate--cysteine ligase CoaBC [Geminicoccus sp.]|uniref:bifunctional phosphopantothenoylcysteine decarboxylase/phosphopantothenate--cysteine ligase CoaBC n=1 Tax=Geminicoccus sp. TaxID=2024832 RepID=UPI002C5C67F1|nr:bifunctional phosphopantothenoylcysteine decarboxylase/phosphopantothenate--cysteine ligase CoaBC [Geminicoccus sp.]HWL70552.1 bifunctional phosphopantothenoylcysteine decarboxylase/phosphopantothenate--cysteine ligase CoaBC [Geminicoccus sp.]
MGQDGIPALPGGRVLLVIGGGIAAYKCLELIRRLKERGIQVRCVLTEAAREFVTPLSVAALSVEKVYGDLFSLTDEAEMGHIRLSREADLVVVAPATANLLAKMAHGLADDLASTVLLATDKPVLAAPAMNQMMWGHPATQRNLAVLQADGVAMVGPNAGDMACGETGSGRMAEPAEILTAILARLGRPGSVPAGGLAGRRALVTSGPTREAIDPVRFIMNHSSGKQGHAIAAELARLGADVTLVSGPVALPDPPGVAVVRVENAREMLAACRAALPADVAVCAAAVADWRPEEAPLQKIKKEAGAPPPAIRLVENPDILRTLAADGPQRPRLVVGFAAETEQVVAHAAAKLRRKNCDWILANDVAPGSGTFGGDRNAVTLLRRDSAPEPWPPGSKQEVARRLAGLIAEELGRG